MTPIILAFRQAGYEVAIDDFGIGYSNLHNLNSLNIDILKIDKSFVETLTTHKTSHLIAEHIIELAHSLGLKRLQKGWKRRIRSTGCANAACAIVRAGTLQRRCRRRFLWHGQGNYPRMTPCASSNLDPVAVITGVRSNCRRKTREKVCCET